MHCYYFLIYFLLRITLLHCTVHGNRFQFLLLALASLLVIPGKKYFPKMTAATSSFKKSFEGVKLTDDLLNLWHDCFSKLEKTAGPSSKNKKDNISLSRMNTDEATRIILTRGDPKKNCPKCIPIEVLRAIQLLSSTNTGRKGLEKLLKGTSLFFTPPPEPKEETEEQRKFRQRMEKLRLQCEETKYSKITRNLQSDKATDDITAKSMTYAASVGLNMIVAPISFGCFMYFFAGGLFDYFLGEEFSSRTTGGTDIKRVIVGVISGVVMLFIEMILFVIRTHEFEAHERKKQKKKKAVQPFGVYSKKVDSALSVPNKTKVLERRHVKES